MLREPGQRSIRPEPLFAGGHEQDDEERAKGRDQEREEDRSAGRAPQRLHAGRREFVGRTRQCLAAADAAVSGQSKQVDQRRHR